MLFSSAVCCLVGQSGPRRWYCCYARQHWHSGLSSSAQGYFCLSDPARHLLCRVRVRYINNIQSTFTFAWEEILGILENILYVYFTYLTRIISELYILYWLIMKWLRSSMIVPLSVCDVCIVCEYWVLSVQDTYESCILINFYSYGSLTIHNLYEYRSC